MNFSDHNDKIKAFFDASEKANSKNLMLFHKSEAFKYLYNCGIFPIEQIDYDISYAHWLFSEYLAIYKHHMDKFPSFKWITETYSQNLIEQLESQIRLIEDEMIENSLMDEYEDDELSRQIYVL